MPTEHVVTTDSVTVDRHSSRCCYIQYSPYSLYNTSVYLCTYIAKLLTDNRPLLTFCNKVSSKVSLQYTPTLQLIIITQFVRKLVVSKKLSGMLVVIGQDWHCVHIEYHKWYIGCPKKRHISWPLTTFGPLRILLSNFENINFSLFCTRLWIFVSIKTFGGKKRQFKRFISFKKFRTRSNG